MVGALLWPLLVQGCGDVIEPLPGSSTHLSNDGFQNTNPNYRPPSLGVRLSYMVARSWTTTFQPRSADLPFVKNDGAALRANRSDATVTWVGHSTLLIQLDGVNILTDPQWSDRASPVTFAGPRRITSPGVAMEDLPPIDLVLISHDHYDHLDVDTVQRLDRLHRPLFLVPLRLQDWFEGIGITNVEELDWWESRPLRGLRVTCLPAQHFSGRTLWDRNRRLWSSWAVAGQAKRLFFAGDTGYYSAFKEIGQRLGPFDLVAVPIGAYVPPEMMKMTHVTPEEALQLFTDVQGRNFLAMHWGTFDLTDEPIEEPPQRLRAEADRLKFDPSAVWVLKHGETRRW